ncbi:UMP-CMP kinase, mitochondrial [Novymonas esmeraldas]|uniref:UMP-CMP kinase, mitochondrial n=1 Tax=Novymonas esmeraldas TaxID=1808958 RepID=A0AAW0ENK1_9TRYP
MSSIASLAQRLHGGTNVYRSRLDCLAVLRAVARSSPAWWTPSCTAFVDEAESLRSTAHASSPGARRHAIVLVEGLDGTGKTLITRTLAARLPGVALSTPPPQFAVLRETFRHEEEAVARAFYSAANYIAADAIVAAAQTSVVVVDRWWCSTCAMALANSCRYDALPPAGDVVYRWPEDLPSPDVGVLLSVDEAVRVARVRKRAPEDAEERRLSAQAEMRCVALEAYRRTAVLTEVDAPSYRAAVNSILRLLQARGIATEAELFTQAELDNIEPY